MDRIKTRQQKFKKGKEKMLSLTQESTDSHTLIPPDAGEEDDDDGMPSTSEVKESSFKLV